MLIFLFSFYFLFYFAWFFTCLFVSGDPTAAYDWILKNGITDDTCMSYIAAQQTCNAFDICRTCSHDGTCSAVANPKKYHILEHGQVAGEENMMAEIYARGPLACTIAVTAAVEQYTGGIIDDKTGDVSLDHEIEVSGSRGQRDSTGYIIYDPL